MAIFCRITHLCMEVVMNSETLNQLLGVFQKITDPRAPKGVRHDFHGMLMLVFLGLLVQLSCIAWTRRMDTVLGGKVLAHSPRPARVQKI